MGNAAPPDGVSPADEAPVWIRRRSAGQVHDGGLSPALRVVYEHLRGYRRRLFEDALARLESFELGPELFQELKAPVIDFGGSRWGHQLYWVVNPALRPLGFVKLVDPYTAWQELRRPTGPEKSAKAWCATKCRAPRP